MSEREKWEERYFQIFSTLLAKHEIVYYSKEKKDEEIKKLLTFTDIIIDNLMEHESKRRSNLDKYGIF